MNRTAARATCVALAVAVTLGVLKGISLLAEVQASVPTTVVVLPRVEITAAALPDSPVDASTTPAESNPL